MYILGIIERQIARLQEVSADADYSEMIAAGALETEIKVSEEIRKLVELHSSRSDKRKVAKKEPLPIKDSLDINNKTYDDMTYEEAKENVRNIRKSQEEKEIFNRMSFGEKIKFYMDEIDMSMEELSCRIELDDMMIDFMMDKCDPKELSLEHIYKLGKALELDMSQIGDLVMSCKI